jgi:hypothetical protein
MMRALAGLLAAGLLVGACSNAPAPRTDITPKPSATPRTMPLDSELALACSGSPVPFTAPYAGNVHPLVVVGPAGEIDVSWAINAKWIGSEWTAIQLVVCVGAYAPTGEERRCGPYSDGTNLVIRPMEHRVKVVKAATGTTLTKKTFTWKDDPVYKADNDADRDSCPAVIMGGEDPEKIQYVDGYMPTTYEWVNEYATRLSEQPVK